MGKYQRIHCSSASAWNSHSHHNVRKVIAYDSVQLLELECTTAPTTHLDDVVVSIGINLNRDADITKRCVHTRFYFVPWQDLFLRRQLRQRLLYAAQNPH